MHHFTVHRILMTPVGFEPMQLALVELESTPLDHSGKVSMFEGMKLDVQAHHATRQWYGAHTLTGILQVTMELRRSSGQEGRTLPVDQQWCWTCT